MNSIKPILIKRKNSYHMGYHLDTYNFLELLLFQNLVLIALYWKLHFQEIQLLRSALNESYGNRMI
ncbi:Uncharacterised protein [Streptococcus pneumoniae]|nr:Uncharacterised protein [Streptococcus pneumoniae]